jgi:hypothetical protein
MKLCNWEVFILFASVKPDEMYQTGFIFSSLLPVLLPQIKRFCDKAVASEEWMEESGLLSFNMKARVIFFNFQDQNRNFLSAPSFTFYEINPLLGFFYWWLHSIRISSKYKLP